MDYSPQFSMTATAAIAIATHLAKHVFEMNPEDLDDGSGDGLLAITLQPEPGWVLADIAEYFDDHCHVSPVKPAIDLQPNGDWDITCRWSSDDVGPAEMVETLFFANLQDCIEAEIRILAHAGGEFGAVIAERTEATLFAILDANHIDHC
jgi:hypothetical protein